MNIFSALQEDKFQLNLTTTVQRLRNSNVAKLEDIQTQRKDIATLLTEKDEISARLQAEKVLIEANRVNAGEILVTQCNELHASAGRMAFESKCPEILKEAVSSLIWAASRLDLAELVQVKMQLVKKYGTKVAADAEQNVRGCVHPQVSKWLSKKLPTPIIVVGYMEEIAKEFEVDWVGTDISRGARMTGPGVYIDEEGRMFQNHRGQSCSALPVPSTSVTAVLASPASSSLASALAAPVQQPLTLSQPGSLLAVEPQDQQPRLLSRPASVLLMGEGKPWSPKDSPSRLTANNFFKKLSGKFAKLTSEKSSVLSSISSDQLAESDSVQPMYLPQPCTVAQQPVVPTLIFKCPSSTYLQSFSEENYSYPCDNYPAHPESPTSPTFLAHSYSNENGKDAQPIFVSALGGLEDKIHPSEDLRIAQSTN